MIYAPVIIPTLNRLDHLKVCLESLSRCTWADKTEVYIGLDFPPNAKYEDGYKQVKAYLDNCGNMGFKKLHIIKREKNYGVVQNFRSLQSLVFENCDRLILCDDDIEFSPNFIQYMDMTLDRYNSDEEVVAVTGYAYPISWKVSNGATCLKQNLNGSDWGLGLWKEKYYAMSDYFYNGMLRKNLKRVIHDKSYKKMIDACKRDYILYACGIPHGNKDKDYWRLPVDVTVRCYLAIEDKYVIAPIISKLKNHGFDGSGVVCDAITEFGDTALTYDYEHQPIDDSKTFSLIEDELQDDAKNRDILNQFDIRTPNEMKRTLQLIWLCEHLGCWAGKMYERSLQPFDAILFRIKRYFQNS